MRDFENMIRIRTVKLLALLCLIGVSQAALAQDKHIDVTVQGSKLVFLNSECPDRPGDLGCVLAEYGNSPMISWELTGVSSDGWTFTGLRFSPTPLQDCTVTDFDLTEADRQSGNASTAQIVANGRRLQIRDRNRNQCITQYTISAASADGRRADSDPIIENRGGGHN